MARNSLTRGTLLLLQVLLLFGGGAAQAGEEAAAEQLFEQGKQALHRVELKRSIELFEQAVQRASDRKLVAAIQAHRGLGQLLLGEESLARKAFEEALRSDPTYNLDPKGFKPEAMVLFAQVRDALRGELALAGSAGAAVWIDGRRVGRLPLTLGISIGRHDVRFRLGEQELRRTVVVFPGQTTHERVTIAAIARQRRVAPRAVVPVEPRRAAPRQRRRFWTWIAAGSAVAVAGVGLGLGISAKLNHDEFITTKDPARFDELFARIRSKVIATNTLFGVGGALAITAAVLFFVEARETDHNRRSSAAERAQLCFAVGPAASGVAASISW